jgi:hypothetical protein
MWNAHLIQVSNITKKLVTLRGEHIQEWGRMKEGVKKVNVVDVLSIQE